MGEHSHAELSRRYTQVRPSRNIPWNTGNTIVTGKKVSRKARKGAKAQRRAISFASLRETCSLNCRTFMCSDKYRHTCVQR